MELSDPFFFLYLIPSTKKLDPVWFAIIYFKIDFTHQDNYTF